MVKSVELSVFSNEQRVRIRVIVVGELYRIMFKPFELVVSVPVRSLCDQNLVVIGK
jgi:hypothetical protein